MCGHFVGRSGKCLIARPYGLFRRPKVIPLWAGGYGNNRADALCQLTVSQALEISGVSQKRLSVVFLPHHRAKSSAKTPQRF